MMHVNWRVYQFDRRRNEWLFVHECDNLEAAQRAKLIGVGGERVIVPWPVGFGWYALIVAVGVLGIFLSI
jgi:hypothetical protein